MKFLITGFGSIGRRHLRNLRKLGEQDIVLYRTHHSTLPEEELAGVQVETDFQRALSLLPEAVIVSNPTSLHIDTAIRAARTGCAILLEKPVSDSMYRMDELADIAEQSGSRILVGFQFRFHPTLRKASELIQNGLIGKILTAHAEWGEYLPGWHPWEDYRHSYAARADLGGGVLRTLTHPFDYLRWLVGEVEEVNSFTGHVSPLELDVEDVAEVGLRFAGGAIGAVHVNYVQRPPVHHLEIVGSSGTLHWDNSDGALHISLIPTAFGSWSITPPPPDAQVFKPPEGFDRNQLFLDQMRHFISVVRGEAEPRCTLDDGRCALEIALAADMASREKKVITIPVDHGES